MFVQYDPNKNRIFLLTTFPWFACLPLSIFSYHLQYFVQFLSLHFTSLIILLIAIVLSHKPWFTATCHIPVEPLPLKMRVTFHSYLKCMITACYILVPLVIFDLLLHFLFYVPNHTATSHSSLSLAIFYWNPYLYKWLTFITYHISL